MRPAHRLLSLALVSVLAFAAPVTLLPSAARAQAVAVSITAAPPPLPVYAQPPIPAPGYLWAPGYWAWGPQGYYWVPGTWVLPPTPGLLWTPGYWAWDNGVYFWHAGYWAPEVGFYGGINYGFGYFGIGFVGGHWDHDRFFYNRAVNNFGGVHITNIYNQPVRNVAVTHVSFNGGRGGTSARPTAGEQAAFAHRVDPTPLQRRHEQAAAGNHAFLASVNHGRPSVAATPRAASFSGPGIVHARGPGKAAPHRPAAVHRVAQPGRGPHPVPNANAAPHPQPGGDHRDHGGAPGGGPGDQSQDHH